MCDFVALQSAGISTCAELIITAGSEDITANGGMVPTCDLFSAYLDCGSACTSVSTGTTTFPAMCGNVQGFTCAEGKTGCTGYSSDQEVNCVNDVWQMSGLCSGFTGAACQDACSLIAESALDGQCTGDLVFGPTVVEPTTAPVASCYDETTMSGCKASTVTGSCQWIDAGLKTPCASELDTVSACFPCSSYSFTTASKNTIKYLSNNKGNTWEAKNAAGDGTYKISVTDWEASSCTWYAAADDAAVTEVGAINFAVDQFNSVPTAIPADREFTMTEIPTDSAAALSLGAAAFTGLLLL